MSLIIVIRLRIETVVDVADEMQASIAKQSPWDVMLPEDGKAGHCRFNLWISQHPARATATAGEATASLAKSRPDRTARGAHPVRFATSLRQRSWPAASPFVFLPRARVLALVTLMLFVATLEIRHALPLRTTPGISVLIPTSGSAFKSTCLPACHSISLLFFLASRKEVMVESPRFRKTDERNPR